MNTNGPSIMIDTDRCTVTYGDPFARFSILRYAVAERRQPCAWCGSRPGRFVYLPDYDACIKRVGSSRLAWADAKAFCTAGCWRAYNA